MNYAPRFHERKVREIQLTTVDWLSLARDLSRGYFSAGSAKPAKNTGKQGKFKLESLT